MQIFVIIFFCAHACNCFSACQPRPCTFDLVGPGWGKTSRNVKDLAPSSPSQYYLTDTLTHITKKKQPTKNCPWSICGDISETTVCLIFVFVGGVVVVKRSVVATQKVSGWLKGLILTLITMSCVGCEFRDWRFNFCFVDGCKIEKKNSCWIIDIVRKNLIYFTICNFFFTDKYMLYW